MKFDIREMRRQKKKNLEERLAFIRKYAAWVKKTPNKIWSSQHSRFMDS